MSFGEPHLTTWRTMIDEERAKRDDGPIVAWTLTDDQLDVSFDSGFGLSEGAAFTAWSDARVYFPVVYDGAEWCGSAPRNPSDEATEHQGGE